VRKTPDGGRSPQAPRQLTLFAGLLEALRTKASRPRKRRVSTTAAPVATPRPAQPAEAPGVQQPARRRRGRLATRGRCCDLAELASEINHRYFDGALPTAITWGRQRPQRRRRRRARRITMQLGSYHPDLDLVRIHPALDRPWVPRYVLESIIYHELLHAALPARIENGRRRVHTPEFRRRERLYPRLAEAQSWVQANLRRLVEER
jgi:hypothetical protein